MVGSATGAGAAMTPAARVATARIEIFMLTANGDAVVQRETVTMDELSSWILQWFEDNGAKTTRKVRPLICLKASSVGARSIDAAPNVRRDHDLDQDAKSTSVVDLIDCKATVPDSFSWPSRCVRWTSEPAHHTRALHGKLNIRPWKMFSYAGQRCRPWVLNEAERSGCITESMDRHPTV